MVGFLIWEHVIHSVNFFNLIFGTLFVERFINLSENTCKCIANFRSSHHSVKPVQRLWCYLVRQKRLENIFFYYCFPRKGDRSVVSSSTQIASANKAVNSLVLPPDSYNFCNADYSDSTSADLPENPVTVIYRDPGNEPVNAICFNNIPLTVSHSIHCLVSATPKDVTESDITDIVSPTAPSADARVFHGNTHNHMSHLGLLHRYPRFDLVLSQKPLYFDFASVLLRKLKRSILSNESENKIILMAALC